jgi:hypothetical protein
MAGKIDSIITKAGQPPGLLYGAELSAGGVTVTSASARIIHCFVGSPGYQDSFLKVLYLLLPSSAGAHPTQRH